MGDWDSPASSATENYEFSDKTLSLPGLESYMCKLGEMHEVVSELPLTLHSVIHLHVLLV